MRKLLIIFLSALSLSMYADDVILPDWFIHPSAHTFVGISEPNGNVHDAINTALIHYLICSNFSGKMSMNTMNQSSNTSTESHTRTSFKLDTTLHYSIEEIISISNNEYICRISDRPNLSRRIIIKYSADFHSLITNDQDNSDFKYRIECFYEDANDKGVKRILTKTTAQNGDIIDYSYTSQHTQGDVFAINYCNVENKEALGEQLITQYMHYLTNGFTKINEGDDTAYHKATPFSGFEYGQGYIAIIP